MFMGSMIVKEMAYAIGMLALQDLLNFIGRAYAYEQAKTPVRLIVDEVGRLVFPGPIQYMKTLSNPLDKNELLVRFANVRADSQPRWGAMSAHQMICHLSDSFRGSLGEKYVSPASSVFKRTLLKWVAP